jgi:hypothetical protein
MDCVSKEQFLAVVASIRAVLADLDAVVAQHPEIANDESRRLRAELVDKIEEYTREADRLCARDSHN